jgi:hypothetical protein
MRIWIVYSTNQVHGVFSTERRALSYKALLERDGVVSLITSEVLNQRTPEPKIN